MRPERPSCNTIHLRHFNEPVIKTQVNHSTGRVKSCKFCDISLVFKRLNLILSNKYDNFMHEWEPEHEAGEAWPR
jgi:hypothetical protein